MRVIARGLYLFLKIATTLNHIGHSIPKIEVESTMASAGKFKAQRFRRKKRSSYQGFNSDDLSEDHNQRKKMHRRPDSMSTWTTETLNEYGISYKNNPISIEEFTSFINSRAHQVCKNKSAEFLSTFKMLCKRGLVFTLDVSERDTLKTPDNPSNTNIQKVRAILTEFDTFVNDVFKNEDEYLGKGWRNKK